jgi:4-diphosphocytidyl-2-C-methyl-D-erythritol kinase
MPPTTRIRAFAKLNLDLRITATRADGYHELRTIFQTIDLHDRVSCVQRPGPFTLRCSDATVPTDRTNLVWRAASALARTLRRSDDVQDVVVTIRKRIPQQAGLGGGSADAAATLVALNALWRGGLSESDLQQTARWVGADVPFLVAGGAALGLGRGDEIYPLRDLPAWGVVLLCPGFGVSTPDAYRLYDEDRRDRLVEGIAPDAWSRTPAHLVNDLEAPVARLHHEIVVMKAALRSKGAVHAAMTGSGSTVFGLFATQRAAAGAARRLRRCPWKVVLTRTLSYAQVASRR